MCLSLEEFVKNEKKCPEMILNLFVFIIERFKIIKSSLYIIDSKIKLSRSKESAHLNALHIANASISWHAFICF